MKWVTYVRIVLLVIIAYVIFFTGNSYSWTTGDVRFDKKWNPWIEIWDKSLCPWDPVDVILVDDEIMKFFGIKHTSSLRFLNRDKITKLPPPIIEAVDKKIRNMKIRIALSGRA